MDADAVSMLWHTGKLGTVATAGQIDKGHKMPFCIYSQNTYGIIVWLAVDINSKQW